MNSRFSFFKVHLIIDLVLVVSFLVINLIDTDKNNKILFLAPLIILFIQSTHIIIELIRVIIKTKSVKGFVYFFIYLIILAILYSITEPQILTDIKNINYNEIH